MPKTTNKSTSEIDMKDEFNSSLFNKETIENFVKTITPLLAPIVSATMSQTFDEKLAEIATNVVSVSVKCDELERKLILLVLSVRR